MGLGSWFIGLGIKAEGLATQIGKRTGGIPLQWPAGPSESLIWRLPRDPHERASIFARSQTMVVNEGEVALVLEDGVAGGSLPPGRYDFERARVVGSLDAIWIKTGQRDIRWGVGNISTIDGIQVSGSGVIYLRVADGVRFNTEVVQGGMVLPVPQLQRFLLPRIQGVLRAEMARTQALMLQTERDAFQTTIQERLDETFAEMGLSIVGFEVVEINLPPEFKAAIAQATMTQHTGAAKLIAAQQQAQMRQIEAAAEAQARLAEGMSSVQLMEAMQARGIDPLKLKALEALETYAENPHQGAGVIGGDMAGAQLFSQVAAAALAGPALDAASVGLAPMQQLPGPGVPGAVVSPDAAAAIPPTPAPEAPPTPAPSGPSPEAAAKLAKVEEQIEKLDDKLLDGEISEDYHEKMMSRLEARRDKLLGGG